MGISLFPHNEVAYQNSVQMMTETGKAAVIHPTGMGKSFIGFQLCAQHPEAKICWLSPSEYIFRTQVENWMAAGGEGVENIKFFTYAKLILMSREELEEIDPSYIILDEFHRCGAEMWEQGVRALLNCHPQADLLGLSATNIRYLDNQWDAPHIYRAHASLSESSDAFEAFKRDSSAHLKLLFCIDMLNEGVYVDDVNGGVLFRPTIYKQQIGRALFDGLQESLTASWDMMYGLAKQFYEEEGHLEVPRRYKTPEGHSLGNYVVQGIWLGKRLNEQKQIYWGKRAGKALTQEQVEKLKSVGFMFAEQTRRPVQRQGRRCSNDYSFEVGV